LGFITALDVPVWVIIFLFVLVYIALGTMMSALPILVITLPITFPVVLELGFDAVWWGIVIIKTIEVGMVSPPFGLNVYVATSAMDEDPVIGFQGASRFIIVDFLVIVLLYQFPQLALYIPQIMV
jgi:TRAP-type C4-dicarboxylate transport system permease large subunit